MVKDLRLDPQQIMEIACDLKAHGVSIVHISPHLEEAVQIIVHAVVLRDGTMTAGASRAEIGLNRIVRNMMGES